MIYSECILELNYLDNLSNAKQALLDLDFIGKDISDYNLLKVWVFEQTIRQCLREELINKNMIYDFNHNTTLTKIASIDLIVGKVAIEMRIIGLFEEELEHYAKLKIAINNKGLDYLYIALNESYSPFKASANKIFGDDKTFYLNEANSWRRFVNKVVELNGYV